MYSAQGAGVLKEVIVHCPGDELDRITPGNIRDYLFDGLIHKDKAQTEHKKLVTELHRAGVTVHFLTDLIRNHSELSDIVKRLPNMFFIRDLAVITADGAIISNMRYPVRAVEPSVMKVALEELGINCREIEPPANLEGGDVLFLDKDTMLVGRSERTNEDGVIQLKDIWLTEEDRTLVKIPIEPVRASMHLDSVIGIVSKSRVCIHSQSITGPVTVYQKGVKEIREPVETFLRNRNIKQIVITSTEQFNMACNSLMIEPDRRLICYERSFEQSLSPLREQGVEPIMLDLSQLFLGAGGPHCMTLELSREE